MCKRIMSTSAIAAAITISMYASTLRADIGSYAGPGLPPGGSPEVPCPAASLDFGVTLDDNGNANACVPAGPIVIDTDYVLGHCIVFGTAVDNFNPPAVGILDDGACSPPCRSSGLAPFTADWWCQFRIGIAPRVPGPLAGVTSFSANLCFIDSPVGTTLMQGYNNQRVLIATAANTVTGDETLTITAPAGQLIAYVRIISSADPAGLSIDCLSYPTCQQRQIPTVSQWGLIVLTLLLLTGATIVLRRRRVPALA